LRVIASGARALAVPQWRRSIGPRPSVRRRASLPSRECGAARAPARIPCRRAAADWQRKRSRRDGGGESDSPRILRRVGLANFSGLI
jgi:hypothetical protein